MKQNKKAKICFVIYSLGIFFLKFLCYEVFAKQKKTELPMNNYWRVDRMGDQEDMRPWTTTPWLHREFTASVD